MNQIKPVSAYIRSGTPSDFKFIIDLQSKFFANDPTLPTNDEIIQMLDVSHPYLLIAEADGKPVGYLLLRDRRFRPWTSIAFIAIVSEQSGNRLGTDLVTEGVCRVRRPFVRLLVRNSNIAALRMYERCGFYRTGKRISNYENGEDALILMRIRKNAKVIR